MPRPPRPLVVLCLLVSLATPAHAESLRIIMVGDSITKGVRPGVKPEETFSALIEKQFQQQGIRASVINAGVGGETTVGGSKRLARDILAKSPHLVAVMYGTNDCYVDKGKTDSRVSLPDFKTHL